MNVSNVLSENCCISADFLVFAPRSTLTATKRYIAENFISKHEKPTLLQQLPIFVAAGTAAERERVARISHLPS